LDHAAVGSSVKRHRNEPGKSIGYLTALKMSLYLTCCRDLFIKTYKKNQTKCSSRAKGHTVCCVNGTDSKGFVRERHTRL
jgi:hypothetical protein